ncbi:MAG TPA: PAS domain S-box protein, partial [Mucilaginibacter sp.]
MPINPIKNLFKKYEQIVKNNVPQSFSNEQDDINYWKNLLFAQFLIYCFPVSFIAAIPSIYISFRHGFILIGVFDCFIVVLLAINTFSKKITLNYRKFIVVVMFYALAVFLIINLGYMGPGPFYLLALTILIALFFPIRFAYYSVVVNMITLFGFAFIIYLRPHNFAMIKDYVTGGWIAYSSNIVFLSALLVILIQMIFNGIQATIIKKDQLQVKYRSIFENSPLPMWLFDIETLQFLDVNDAAIAHYGYSREEFTAMTIRDIRPPEEVRQIEFIVKDKKETLKFRNDNIIHLKKNGEKINVKIESSLLEFNGRTAKLVLATDITTQLKNEQAVQSSNLKLKQSEYNLRAIFESANEGFILLDINNAIRLFNLKAKESIIFNSEQIEFGKNIFDIIATPVSATFSGLLQRTRQGETTEFESKKDTDGELCWMHFTLTPVYEAEMIVGTCITGRNTTAHKKYVQTIEEQNKAFKEISWIQSHLVRAPLARVMGLASLLSEAKNDNEKEEILKFLLLSSNELDEIIKEITKKTNPASNSPGLTVNDD